jgi:hypothetical protein
MKKIKTEHDGWDCLPDMEKLAECVSQVSQYDYEIKHCVRKSSVKDIMNAYRNMALHVEYILDRIEEYEDVEFITESENNQD